MRSEDEIIVDVEELQALKGDLKYVLPAVHPLVKDLSGLWGTKKAIPPELKKDFWALYEKHKAVLLFKKKILFITVKIYVHTLKPLFEIIFGKPSKKHR